MKMHSLCLLFLLAAPMSMRAQTTMEGKLFFTGEQRQYLDYLRKEFLAKNKKAGFDIEDSQVPEIPTNAPGSPTGPVEYSLDALMARADGRVTIWLNHHSITEQQLPANMHLVHEGNTLALRVITNDGSSKLLRTGQIIDITSGMIQERSHKPAPVTDRQKPDNPLTAAASGSTTPDPAAKADDKAAANPANGKATATNPATNNPPAENEAAPPEASKDATTLDTMIQTLKFVREGLDANKNK